MEYIDLHVHTNASDGSLSPKELVDYAISKNLYAIAITDHDTIAGVEEAINYSNLINSTINKLKVIPGVELSAAYNGQDIHILGLNIDYNNQYFKDKLIEFRNLRNARNEKMLKLLRAAGFDFSDEMISNRFGNSVITRAHYAILMVERGYVKDKDTAFKKYLNKDCPCYVPRTMISVEDAVKLITTASGKPILAHPYLYKLSETELDELVCKLKNAGLLGIEAIYSTHSKEDQEKLILLAKKYNLNITGGSDFHGTAKPNLDLGTGYGNLKIPKEILEWI